MLATQNCDPNSIPGTHDGRRESTRKKLSSENSFWTEVNCVCLKSSLRTGVTEPTDLDGEASSPSLSFLVEMEKGGKGSVEGEKEGSELPTCRLAWTERTEDSAGPSRPSQLVPS